MIGAEYGDPVSLPCCLEHIRRAANDHGWHYGVPEDEFAAFKIFPADAGEPAALPDQAVNPGGVVVTNGQQRMGKRPIGAAAHQDVFMPCQRHDRTRLLECRAIYQGDDPVFAAHRQPFTVPCQRIDRTTGISQRFMARDFAAARDVSPQATCCTSGRSAKPSWTNSGVYSHSPRLPPAMRAEE